MDTIQPFARSADAATPVRQVPRTRSAGAASPEHELDSEPSRPAGARRLATWLVTAAWPLPTVSMLVMVSAGATSAQLWRDEVATWSAATRSLADLRDLGSHTDAVIVPYYVFMHFWTAIFGDSELALRAPSMLAMVGVAAVTALLGRALVSPVCGMLAGLVLAFIPAVSRFGHEARPYALVSFAVVLATYLFVRALARPTWMRWACYSAAVCAVGFAHAIALLVLAAHGLAMIFWATAGRRRWRWVVATAAGLLPLLPLLMVGRRQHNIQLSAMGAPDLRSLLVLPSELFHSGPGAGAVILIGLCGAAALWTAPGRSLKPAVLLLGVWAVGSCLMLWLVSQMMPMWFTRYLLFCLPAWALLAAVALVRAAGERVAMVVVISVAGLAALSLGDQLAIRGPLAHENHLYPSGPPSWAPPNPDLRATAAYLRAEQKPGDVLVFRSLSYPWPALGLSYELRHGARPLDVLLVKPVDVTDDWLGERCEGPRITACLGHPARIWVVDVTRDPAASPLAAPMSPELAKAIGDGYRATTTWRGSDVNVTLFTA